MSLDTWVSIAALAAVAITLFGQGRATRTELKRDIAASHLELKGDIAGLRTELKGDIVGLRTELKGDIAESRAEAKDNLHSVEASIRNDLRHLDDRVYALAAGLKPEIERAAETRRLGLTPHRRT